LGLFAKDLISYLFVVKVNISLLKSMVDVVATYLCGTVMIWLKKLAIEEVEKDRHFFFFWKIKYSIVLCRVFRISCEYTRVKVSSF
jgi:hypothetical protein